MKFESFPFIMGWELTLACNIRCRHCGSSAGKKRPNELSLEDALNICNQFPALLVKEVDFTGGEPLLYPRWDDITLHLARLEITTRMLTNGLALTKDNISRMLETNVQSIGVSLDGLEKTHDYIRGSQNLFRNALMGIERALSAGIKVSVITTINALNLLELPELINVLLSVGVTRWQIQPIFPLGRCKDTNELHLTEDSYLEIGMFFKDFRAKVEKRGLMIVPADSLGYFTDYDVIDPPWRGCPAGIISCGITSDGKVKGCLSLPDEIFEGDLRVRNLWDIWFDQETFSYTRRFTKKRLGPMCNSCGRAEQCHGGCSTMSYGYTGQFFNDPYCFYGILSRQKPLKNQH